MVQASTKITTECEYEVMCDLSNSVICNALKWLTQVLRSWYFSFKSDYLKTVQSIRH